MYQLVLLCGVATTLFSITLADTYPLYTPVKLQSGSEEDKYLSAVSYVDITKGIENKEDSDESNKKYAIVEISKDKSKEKESEEKEKESQDDDENRKSEHSREWKKYEKKDEKNDDEERKDNKSEDEEEKENKSEDEKDDEEKESKRDYEKDEDRKNESKYGNRDDERRYKTYQKDYEQNRQSKNNGINSANVNIVVKEKGENREKVIIDQTDEKDIRVRVIDPQDTYNKKDVALIHVSIITE